MLILTFECLPSYQSLKAFGITPRAPPRKTNIVTSTGFARRTRIAARAGLAPSASAPAATPPAARMSRRVSFFAPAASVVSVMSDAPSLSSTWTHLDDATAVRFATRASFLEHRGARRVPSDLDAVARRDRRRRVVRARRDDVPPVREAGAVVDVGAVEGDLLHRRVEDVPAGRHVEPRRDRDPLRPHERG